MYECLNCGMLPFACVCIPWCWRHNVPAITPCQFCVIELRGKLVEEATRKAIAAEHRAARKSFLVPWYARLWQLFIGAV